MAGVVSVIENDKIYIIDEIQIWSSNTNEMIDEIKNRYPNENIIFCNGGERNKNNIPEMKVKGIEFRFGIGGNDKKILHHHYLKTGNMIVRIEYGDLFIIFMIQKR